VLASARIHLPETLWWEASLHFRPNFGPPEPSFPPPPVPSNSSIAIVVMGGGDPLQRTGHYRGAGTDGKDLGADVDAIHSAADGAE
jgi:hypothetical protein